MNFATRNLAPPSVDGMMQFNVQGYDEGRTAAEYEQHQRDIQRALAETNAKALAFEVERAPLAEVIHLDSQRPSEPSTESLQFPIAQ
jgi:hypothetical protein